MTSFVEQLKWCQRRGLTIGDLRWWFGRDYHTVREWVVNRRCPTGPRVRKTKNQMVRLQKAILLRAGFPVPLDLSKRERAQYMRLLGEGKLARARFLASRSPEHRVVRRIRKKRKFTKAVGRRDLIGTFDAVIDGRRTRV